LLPCVTCSGDHDALESVFTMLEQVFTMPEWVITMRWNGWSRCAGMGVHDALERAK